MLDKKKVLGHLEKEYDERNIAFQERDDYKHYARVYYALNLWILFESGEFDVNNPKASDKCRWIKSTYIKHSPVAYHTSCNNVRNCENYWNDDTHEFTYCPFCGHEIEEVDDNGS